MKLGLRAVAMAGMSVVAFLINSCCLMETNVLEVTNYNIGFWRDWANSSSAKQRISNRLLGNVQGDLSLSPVTQASSLLSPRSIHDRIQKSWWIGRSFAQRCCVRWGLRFFSKKKAHRSGTLFPTTSTGFPTPAVDLLLHIRTILVIVIGKCACND